MLMSCKNKTKKKKATNIVDYTTQKINKYSIIKLEVQAVGLSNFPFTS